MFRNSRDLSQKSSSKASEASSAYERLNSGRAIASQLLPSFMRSTGPSKSITLFQSSERPRSPMYSSFDRPGSRSPDSDNFTSFFHSIFDSSRDPSDIVLKVRHRDIYREDLRTFASGEALTRGIIDGCLSIIKQLNHDFLIKDEANDKVIISSTEFSQGIFCNTKSTIFHAPTYVMKYE
jgi:hypothetical protein